MAKRFKVYAQGRGARVRIESFLAGVLTCGLLSLLSRTPSAREKFNNDSRFEAPGKTTPLVAEDALQALRRMASKLNSDVTPQCNTKMYGSAWGQHTLCDVRPAQPCVFYSFGISRDYSFDADVANQWGCQGFAADPTVIHPAKIHANVTFHSIGAKMRGPSPFPLVTSMPSLRKWLGHNRIAILKMDCEGCEYSLAEDVAVEDPHFFDHVDQFAIEVHVSKNWLHSEDALRSLGMLYRYLEDAGLELQHAEVLGCDPKHEQMGCMAELEEMGYPCGLGKSCHNYLFAKAG